MTHADAMAIDGLTATPARPRRRVLTVLLIAGVVVLFDQLTKHWAVTSLGEDRMIDVVWTLRFNLSFNQGMAFSTGTGLGPIIGVVALCISAVVFRWSMHQTSRAARVASGLVIGGALGNVVDRVFRGDAWMRGAVVDFIDFQWFPIFNVADSAVNIGGAVFVVWTMLSPRHASSTEES
jgi:signal peptidase II